MQNFQKPFHNNVKGKAKGVCVVSGGMVQLQRKRKFIFIVGLRHEIWWLMNMGLGIHAYERHTNTWMYGVGLFCVYGCNRLGRHMSKLH